MCCTCGRSVSVRAGAHHMDTRAAEGSASEAEVGGVRNRPIPYELQQEPSSRSLCWKAYPAPGDPNRHHQLPASAPKTGGPLVSDLRQGAALHEAILRVNHDHLAETGERFGKSDRVTGDDHDEPVAPEVAAGLGGGASRLELAEPFA